MLLLLLMTETVATNRHIRLNMKSTPVHTFATEIMLNIAEDICAVYYVLVVEGSPVPIWLMRQ